MTTAYLLVSQAYQGLCTLMGARPAIYRCYLTCVRLSSRLVAPCRNAAHRQMSDEERQCATAARAWAKPTGTEGGPWVIRRRKGILAWIVQAMVRMGGRQRAGSKKWA